MWEETDEGIFRRSLSFSFHWTGRSNSSRRLLHESLSSSSAAVLQVPTAGYHRLSQSMRLFSEEEGETETSRGINAGLGRGQRRRLRRWQVGDWLGNVLTIRHVVYCGFAGGRSTACSEEGIIERKDRRKRCSWLPDPDRRWPIQGW